ncbi:hypothetical protein O9929_17465 [Vibrio lentus]|nr:hypothetical protein [Vibrio lentus]
MASIVNHVSRLMNLAVLLLKKTTSHPVTPSSFALLPSKGVWEREEEITVAGL